MIVLPWYVRFAMDCILFAGPVIYLQYHPGTFIFQYFQDKRRIVRRKTFDDCQLLANRDLQKEAEVIALYKDLGMEL